MAEPQLRIFGSEYPIQFVHVLEADERVSGVVWLAGADRSKVQTVMAESFLRPHTSAITTAEPPFPLVLAVRYFVSGAPADRFRIRTEMSQEGFNPATVNTDGILDDFGRTDVWALIATDKSLADDQRWLGSASRLWAPPLSGSDASGATRAYAPGAPRQPKRAPAKDIRDYTVWFGTNRTPKVRGEKVIDFAAYRSDVVRFGRCRVSIPKTHAIGTLGSSVWTRLRTGIDDRLKIQGITTMSPESYWAEIREALASSVESDRDAVVFLHGYKTPFKNAALRAAQLGVDLGISGVMAFYSWPSKGTYRGYAADAASIEASEGAITDYLTAVAAISEAQKIHIIAHSMGNRALLRAVNRICITASARSSRHFNQIVLAAADVDADVFRSLSGAYAQVADRTTMYVGPKDKALRASSFLHSFPRAGFTPPVMIVNGVDTVSVEHLDLMGFGHGYVAEMRELLSDIHDLLKNGTSPQKRFGIQPAICAAGPYWVVAR
jgi:esterase/lipase superfamily enzyme